MMSARHILSVTALGSILLHATPARVDLCGEILDFGQAVAEQERPARQTRDDHTLVPRTLIEGIHYVGHTSWLPAQLCLRFGVSVRLRPDVGKQLPDQLIVVVTHPRITRPDQASSTQDSFPTPVLGDTVYAGWTFDHPWEQQPGEWVIAFMNEGQVVASQAFTITAPVPAPPTCQPNPIS